MIKFFLSFFFFGFLDTIQYHVSCLTKGNARVEQRTMPFKQAYRKMRPTKRIKDFELNTQKAHFVFANAAAHNVCAYIYMHAAIAITILYDELNG